MALWVGQTISQFGTYIAVLTVPLLVLYIQEAAGNENTLDFAIAYALETAPTLLVGLIGGVFLDRVHLRPVMIATDLLRACAFFYLAAGVGSYGVGTVFAMAFIVGSMTTLFDGALYAMIPALVPKDRLSEANSFVTASIQASFAFGPLVAGVLAFAFAGPAFLIKRPQCYLQRILPACRISITIKSISVSWSPGFYLALCSLAEKR
jgi:MFS family permease